MNIHVENEPAIREGMAIAHMVGTRAVFNKYDENRGATALWQFAIHVEA